MKNIYKYFVLFFMSMAGTAFAQQDTNHTFYRYNMNLINPAYAGVDDNTEIGINFRSQWSGVIGAPETQSVFFGTGLGKQVGLGVSIINDRTYIENQTSVMLDFSYQLKLSTESDLYLGIKAGGSSYNVNTDGLTTFGIGADPSLSNLDGGFTPNVGVGALIKGEKYFLSFSVPKILSPDRLDADNGTARLGSDKVHMYLGGGYDVALGENLTLKPSVLAGYVAASPLRLDLTATLSLNDRFEFGGGYRLNEGFSGMAIFNAADWVWMGYAYEAPFENSISRISKGSHEVFMRFNL